MRRRGWAIIGAVLGTLALLVIIIWPAAPLWQSLGAQPYCIRGTWPHLEIVACPAQAPLAVATVRPLPTVSAQGPTPLIVDDDGSPDGMVALLYFLRNPLFDVKAVTVSAGEAHPDVFLPKLQRLMAGLGRADIPVGAGRATPLQGSNAFPEPWRQASDDFWGVDYPEATPSLELASASDLIVDTIKASPRPVTLFVSGMHTNLAEALRLDPGIAANIEAVYVMGGSLRVPGNIHNDWPDIDNTVSEWNIWVDPLAADEVFTSGLPIHLAPLDATNQVRWTESDARQWGAGGSPEAALAVDLLRMMLDSWSSSSVYLWDLVPAVWATDPKVCPEVPRSVDVVVAAGPDQGRTVITDRSPNAAVCLGPDRDQLRALAAAVLSR
jgi:purine nucleosidase/pyrimidine-specific ribonucleoside hydrolase